MDNRDDRQAMWLDINRNGVFELSEGEKLGNAPWDVNNIKVNLEAGKSYKFAMLSGEYGGGSKFRSRITAPGLSQRVIKPLDNAQKGMFTYPLLSNGKDVTTNLKPEVQLTGLVKGAKYFYRFYAENTPEGGGAKQIDWSDSTGSFTAEKVLDFETGTISFNTSDATWSHSSGAAGKGEIESLTWTDQQG